MVDYKNKKYSLYNKITDTIIELQEVQQQTEIYTSQEEKSQTN